MKINTEQLKKDIATVVDTTFALQLVDSYTKMQQRYYAGDWQPSELNGGQFCEAIARAFYQLDTGIVNHSKGPGELVGLLKSKSSPHILSDKDRDHFCRVLQATYNFRNDRGVAHISPIYTANHLDATLVIANVKWLFAEFLRIAWKRDPQEVVGIIESILQLEHPLIHELDGEPLILTDALSAAEEALVLLLHSGNGQLTKEQLKQYINKDQTTVSKAISRLSNNKEVRMSKTGEVVITPLGVNRVHKSIIPKLTAPGSKSRIASVKSSR